MVINPFESALLLLQEFGFFSVVLPLILVFAIFYGILEKTKIFDIENHQAINSIIAFVAAFFVISSTPVVKAINDLLPSASLLLIISMLVLMLLAFWGFKTEEAFGKANKWAALGAIVLILIFLGMIDLALGIKIPIIHELAMAMVGQGATAGIGGAGFALSQEAINMIISFALIFGLPLIVILIIVLSGKKNS